MSERQPDRLDQVIEELKEFVREREWEQFHDPKNLAMAVASEAGELLSEYRWISNLEADAPSRDDALRERVEAEAADVGIALVLFADRVGFDLLDAMHRKIEVNRSNYPVAQTRGRASRPNPS